MVVFFFDVGLEIKPELVTGELRDRRAAASSTPTACRSHGWPTGRSCSSSSTGSTRSRRWSAFVARPCVGARQYRGSLDRHTAAPFMAGGLATNRSTRTMSFATSYALMS
jgi:hypothetical protein